MVMRRDRRRYWAQNRATGSRPACAGDTPTDHPWREVLPRVASGYIAVAVVLAAHFLIAVASVRQKSNTFDELGHITAGFSYWKYNDYRLDPENGILPKRWFALPLLTMGLKFPDDQRLWATCDWWAIGTRFFFESGNAMEKLLWGAMDECDSLGRSGTSRLCLVATAIWARRRDGFLAGLCYESGHLG